MDRRDSSIGQKRQQYWTEETAALDRRDSSIGQRRQQHWTEETAALDRGDRTETNKINNTMQKTEQDK